MRLEGHACRQADMARRLGARMFDIVVHRGGAGAHTGREYTHGMLTHASRRQVLDNAGSCTDATMHDLVTFQR